MKKLAGFICILLILGCGNKTASKTTSVGSGEQDSIKNLPDSFAFEVDTFHVVRVQKNCKGSECTTCDLYYEKIRTGGMPVFDSVNLYIDSLLPEALMDAGGSGKIDLEKIAADFIETSTQPEFAEMGGTWSYELNLTISRPSDALIEVSCSYGGYTGGAHGNYVAQTASFYVENGRRATMENLFNEPGKVNKIGLKYFKKDNGLTQEDIGEQGWDVDDENFTLNDNFSIGSESIVWQYNSYEIGSYANGAPTVTIPMKELEKYLKVKLY